MPSVALAKEDIHYLWCARDGFGWRATRQAERERSMPCDLSALARSATAEALAKEGINDAMKLPWLRMAGHPPTLSQRESYGEVSRRKLGGKDM